MLKYINGQSEGIKFIKKDGEYAVPYYEFIVSKAEYIPNRASCLLRNCVYLL